MKIYFMKQSALDYIKENIGTLYKNYFQFDTPDWISDLFDYDPFETFDVVEDFELAELNQQPGEIDMQNCKILYSKLHNLTDSQASDERLWAGLCNKNFYSYLRTRWEYARRHLRKTADDSQAILVRFYFKTAGRSGMFRNTLARCWWTGRLTYSEKYSNHWELLDAIGSEDFISKISDIFYSNTYSSNIEIVEGFCQGLKFFRDRNIRFTTREHIRPTAQYLNAVGGAVLLDMFSANDIKNIVIERMGLLIKGVDPGLLSELYEDSLDDGDIGGDADAEEVNVDFAEYLDSLEATDDLNLDSVLGQLTEVEYGCKVLIHNSSDNSSFISSIPLVSGQLNRLQSWFLGKSVGATANFGGRLYEIIGIYRQ